MFHLYLRLKNCFELFLVACAHLTPEGRLPRLFFVYRCQIEKAQEVLGRVPACLRGDSEESSMAVPKEAH